MSNSVYTSVKRKHQIPGIIGLCLLHRLVIFMIKISLELMSKELVKSLSIHLYENHDRPYLMVNCKLSSTSTGRLLASAFMG